MALSAPTLELVARGSDGFLPSAESVDFLVVVDIEIIMAVFVLSLVFLLAITGHSDASYCTCNDGLSTDVYQKNIDYACGAGADCSPITQNGPCFQPNTVKDHCNYAVNSYYQKKGQNPQSCNFLNTATVTQSAPTASSGCVYPSSPSNTGTGTAPPTTPSTGGTPTFGGTPPHRRHPHWRHSHWRHTHRRHPLDYGSRHHYWISGFWSWTNWKWLLQHRQ
ncbi:PLASMODESMATA CALLOSE-BINDING PROTEIN 3 [Abeliophyllum distichum]|uniref:PLASMODESMATA CALLOSE-BINDING PROTEIN 3 n=1 Tax=Abeliophyllum distichum TaxID=126358 RepID=A0ABD1U2R1_9LAMI